MKYRWTVYTFSCVVLLGMTSVDGFSPRTRSEPGAAAGAAALLRRTSTPHSSYSTTTSSGRRRSLIVNESSSSPQDSSSSSKNCNVIWRPALRRIMGGIAAAGGLETAYLTLQTVVPMDTLCGINGGGSNCRAVLAGPYSTLPFTDIPLSAAGFIAYALVAYLALEPILLVDDGTVVDDSQNRIALTTLTTAMATFSIGLMILLFGVLQTTCPYCIFSATCSVSLGMLALLGRCLPSSDSKTTSATVTSATAGTDKEGAGAVSSAFLASTFGVILLFISSTGDDDAGAALFSFPPSSQILLAKANGGSSSETTTDLLLSPPAITTESSKRAMDLANSLQSMDAKMYGAYWCSHCYDQKELFGKQAFSKIDYVECSKDGVNSQTKLCKSKNVPGYPTWEIQGQLYPGQQELEELEQLVNTLETSSS